jgi:DNA helicase-2/ATP-dependent DNA helicase PcrA
VDPARQVEVHTYHGFAAQVLAEFGVLAGVDSRAGVITPTFTRQLIREVFYARSYRHLDMTWAGTLDRIRRLGDQLGDHLLSPEDVLRGATIHDGDEIWAARVEMAETLRNYNQAKRDLRVVDYADLITVSTKVLTEHPGLASSVRDRYRIVVLDEYQDTNPAQRVLLSTIFGDGFPVIAVGDEDQTIYEWRGASAENFELFTEQFPTTDGRPAHDESLTLNRRSGGGILSVANDVRRKANPTANLLQPADDFENEIVTFWARDALAEAEWIARQFEALHDRGEPWSKMAVLFRKNKDFAVVIDALGRHDVPVEVANVGGLLSVPEVSLLRAWLTAIHNPEDSTAIAHLLFGSTHRLGIADLAVLAGWLAQQTPEDPDAEEPHPVTLIEAIESEEATTRLSPEARARVTRFRDTYRRLVVETQGLSLAETCRLILDRTRAWQDVESLPPSARLSARLNLYRFLDLADDWSPLSGRPSLGAFLDYLDLMEEEPAEELDSARLSGEEAVTLITVHRAKGLEWESVAIPAVFDGNFPASSGAFPDPVRFAHELPIEFRLDTTMADLPDADTDRAAFFRERHRAQEWRVAYVAVTRAKRRLFVSGSYWYGLPEPRHTPSKPSELFLLIEENEHSRSDGHAEPGPRPEILRAPEETAGPDPLFPGGWQEALRAAAESPGWVESVARAEGLEPEYRRLAQDWQDRLFRLDDETAGGAGEEPPMVSVTGLVTYASCPRRFYWSEVDPLPRRRNPAAVRGNEIHRRIELHQRGQVPFDDLEPGLYDVVDPVEGDGGGFLAYESSRFAQSRAELVEAPFTVTLENGCRVRGRIDAVYVDDDRWEVVDFKSGRRHEDPSRIVQLQAYAVAVNDVDFGRPPPRQLDVTFAYLGGGIEEASEHANEDWVGTARARLVELTDAIVDEQYEPTPGRWCRSCDFLRFCAAGRAEVGE